MIRKTAVLELFDGDEITAVPSERHVDASQFIHIQAVSGHVGLDDFIEWAKEVQLLMSEASHE